MNPINKSLSSINTPPSTQELNSKSLSHLVPILSTESCESLSSNSVENLTETESVSSSAPETPLLDPLEWEKSIRKEHLAPVSKRFFKIILNLDSLSEFHSSFNPKTIRGRINSSLIAIEKIKSDPNYETFREPLSQKSPNLQMTLDWVEPCLKRKSEELDLKIEINKLFTTISSLEGISKEHLTSLEDAIKKLVDFYEHPGLEQAVEVHPKASVPLQEYQEILKGLSLAIRNHKKPKNSWKEFCSFIEEKNKTSLESKGTFFLNDLKNAHREYNEQKTLISFSNLERKANRLISFYKEIQQENPNKEYIKILETDIFKMPEDQFQALKR